MLVEYQYHMDYQGKSVKRVLRPSKPTGYQSARAVKDVEDTDFSTSNSGWLLQLITNDSLPSGRLDVFGIGTEWT